MHYSVNEVGSIKKVCSRCRVEKDIVNFAKNRSAEDGYTGYCRICRQDYIRKYRDKLIEQNRQIDAHDSSIQKRCYCCSEHKTPEHFPRLASNNDGLSGYCKDCAKIKQIDLKIIAFEEYGGTVCCCCGESDIYVLSLDHVFNDGGEQRKKPESNNLYSRLARLGYPNKDRFQVLCFNCNWAKARNDGALPEWRRGINKK